MSVWQGTSECEDVAGFAGFLVKVAGDYIGVTVGKAVNALKAEGTDDGHLRRVEESAGGVIGGNTESAVGLLAAEAGEEHAVVAEAGSAPASAMVDRLLKREAERTEEKVGGRVSSTKRGGAVRLTQELFAPAMGLFVGGAGNVELLESKGVEREGECNTHVPGDFLGVISGAEEVVAVKEELMERAYPGERDFLQAHNAAPLYLRFELLQHTL